MKVIITGVAGFIGAALAERLLSQGMEVIGIDNLNDYYDIGLKKSRLSRLEKAGQQAFTFIQADISDKNAILPLASAHQDTEYVFNMAAQAGVRYSIENPFAYAETNVLGFMVIAEMARRIPKLKQFIYASSSSVYGGNSKTPFAIEDAVTKPVSVYGATKISNELFAHTYAHLYGINCTGLRFFTVYGPWGRPDMAAYLFTSKIMAGEPIPVFNNGDMRRDFTYIDDIIDGVAGAMNCPMNTAHGSAPARVYNLGNSKSETLMDYIKEIEQALGKKAVYDLKPMQAGDVYETYADISLSTRDFGYAPKTAISEGIPKFVEWYKSYHKG